MNGYPAIKHMKKNFLFTLIQGGRWRLSIAAALVSVLGALVASPKADFRLAAIFAGSVFFALAVTWFNQIQERQTDGLMSRTKKRPLANNSLPVEYAIIWAMFCLAASFVLLFMCGGWSAIVILFVVIFFYNGIYTPMKKRSLFALILGAVAGAAPPVLGWECAGGRIFSIEPFTLFLLFFVWQIPHFWLVVERNGLDYESAEFPLPWRYFGDRLYRHILILWILAFCVALLALPAFGLVHSTIAQMFVLFISAAFVITVIAFHLLKHPHIANQPFNPSILQPVSISLNFSMTVVCAILVAEKIFGG